jgi:hypothetical protein
MKVEPGPVGMVRANSGTGLGTPDVDRMLEGGIWSKRFVGLAPFFVSAII